MTQTIDVLIVGAGPVGLFCANELHRQGIRCRIIDKKSALSDKSKALAIHIRTLEVLEDCYFINDFLEKGYKVHGVLIKSNDTVLSEANFEKLGTSYDFLIDLPQSETEQIFYQGLVEKNINVEWQSELISFKEGEPLLAFVKKADGQTEEIAAKWLIACDGSHSTLRDLCHAQFQGAEYKERWWLADVHMNWTIPENKIIIYVSPNGPLACFPMGNQRYRFVMTAPLNKSDQPTFEDIVDVFNERSSDPGKLFDPAWISAFSIHHRQIDKYRYGHVFFCGDAAHIHSPMGGQGLNTGIQDTYNLAWKLNLVVKGYANESLLDTYHEERHPIAKAVLKKTDIMTKLFTIKNKTLITLRNKIASKLTSYDVITSPILQDLAQLDISYAKSSIVKAHGQKTRFKLGEFIPLLTLKSLRHRKALPLEKICQDTLHHVFVFLKAKEWNESIDKKLMALAKDYQDVLQVHLVITDALTSASELSSVWIDENYILQERFNIKQSATLVIRPDKYIGFIESPFNMEQLETWLETIFSIKTNHE
ncbi:FAD dependent oxidoreductase [Legionella beliardensis]|uniref:FAD dependent oxidoreductase n=1 Tax=Legionella beliardensis TaxID=91822 RepID=A0A378I5X7_9GAMM|nr:FAD-dependent monooxygenase [Legionella beliardensis]STX27874.1 FAD dependent oxidoreductase [Legionella beliardensis]